MEPFRTVCGPAIPLGLSNVDTDVIIPASYLKTVTRSGLGAGAFKSLRYNSDGTLKEDAIFHQSRYLNAPLLIAGENFGCGSSRVSVVR